jgi:hypothetical protein
MYVLSGGGADVCSVRWGLMYAPSGGGLIYALSRWGLMYAPSGAGLMYALPRHQRFCFWPLFDARTSQLQIRNAPLIIARFGFMISFVYMSHVQSVCLVGSAVRRCAS